MEITVAERPADRETERVADRVAVMVPADRISRPRELEAQVRSIEAELGVLVHAIGADGLFRDEGHLTIGAFLRGELRWSHRQVVERTRLGRAVASVPEVADHLSAGAIGVDQAALLARAATHPRCGDRFVEHASLLFEHARVLDHAAFATVVQRWVSLADADGANQDAETHHEHRSATLSFHDGVSRLYGRGAAVDHAEFSAIFDQYRHAEFLADLAQAKALHGDDAADAMLARTNAQRAWDALMQMARDAASTPPGSQAPEPVINVVCDITTLEAQYARSGLIPDPADHGRPALRDLPFDLRRCETNHGIPLSPAQVMQLAFHGRLRRVVLDTDGVVLDYGRLRRLFEGAVRDAVLSQSHTCVFPGCERPASWCEADHIVPWSKGGATSVANGAPMCAKHNRLRNRGFTVWRDPNGVFHLYHPDGHEIAAPPPKPPGTSPPDQPDAA